MRKLTEQFKTELHSAISGYFDDAYSYAVELYTKIMDLVEGEFNRVGQEPENEPQVSLASVGVRPQAKGEWVDDKTYWEAPQPQDALDVQNAKRWRWAFALSPDWSYAVCKWDGDDWLPINTDEDMRDLDAAIAASEKGETK